MAHFYTLNRETKEITPIGERDYEGLEEWIAARTIQHVSYTGSKDGNIRISTIFVGINYRFFDDGEPLVFETMIFGGEYDGECAKWPTWKDANDGHEVYVKAVLGEDVIWYMRDGEEIKQGG